MNSSLQMYLEPTSIIDSDHEDIRAHAERIVHGWANPVEKAVRLYLAVRDGIRYDPYSPFHLPEHYRAGYVLRRGRSFCIPKASLLCALARACGIPSRLGFATVRNHLATRQLLEFLGSDLFVYHGYVELHLEGRWVKATPAFNRELCERHKVPPLEFNGREDSIFQPYNRENRRFMEYVEDFGTHRDVPVDEILKAWKKAYGEDFIERSTRFFEARGTAGPPCFESEEIWNG